MSCRRLFLATLAAIALAASPAFAQNQDQDVPTLTTEMVAPATIETPDDTAQKPDQSGLTPEEQADAARSAKKDDADSQGGPDKGDAKGPKGPSPEELRWRSQVSAAEQAASGAQARADEAEIELTTLRNNLGVQSTVDERNALAAQIEQQGAVIAQARQQALEAKAALDGIKTEGRANNFKPAPGPSPVTASGSANAAYYQQRYNKALAEQTDAERRIQVYQDRVSLTRSQLNLNSGSGDAFTQARYTQALNEAESDLAKVQNDLAIAQANLESIANEAQAAGISISQP